MAAPERAAGRTVRAFIAVPLPEPLCRALAALQRELRPHLTGVRWTRPETSHLTLAFLGAVAEESLETIAAVMLSVGVAAAPFSLRVAGLGTFPSRQRPRVLWAGLGDDGPLQLLQLELTRALAAHGCVLEERPFRPHLTLGRWPGQAPPLPQLPPRLFAADLGHLEVARIILYESRLHAAGAEHIPLQAVILGRNGGAVGPASPGGA